MPLAIDENMALKVVICYCTLHDTSVKCTEMEFIEYICNLIIRNIVNPVRFHWFYGGQIAL